MKYRRIEIPLQSPVVTLSWCGDQLIDWAGGIRVFHLDGTSQARSVSWAHGFDAAITSPSGKFAVIYKRLGTKALVIQDGKLNRELNRSFYHAEAYEYPVAFIRRPDGRELIVHCPERYNYLEIEDAETGERLTQSSDRQPQDYFHSRLSVSQDNRRLLSAGWIWHPFSTVGTWLIDEVLANPQILDQVQQPKDSTNSEINSAAFIDSDHLLVTADSDAEDHGDEGDSPFHPGHLAKFNLVSNSFELIVKADEPLGAIMSLGDDRCVSFYESPKVVSLTTSEVIQRWPDLLTGKQTSSILLGVSPLPPLALDPANKRFAVATPDRIVIIICE